MEISQSHMKLLEDEEMGSSREWRKALKSQPAYRIVNRTLRSQTQFITMVAFLGLFVLIVLYMYPKSGSAQSGLRSSNYNYTYPLSMPIKTSSMYTFRIGIIADLDTSSKSDKKNVWRSYYKKGFLSYSPVKHTVAITWDPREPVELTSSYALKGRGMELSELVVFDGRLLTFDDRTGLIYEIINDKVIPWVLLLDGDGRTEKGFKSEWATVKNELLYVGSMGKEWTTAGGDFENNNPQYLKAVTTKGQVDHINWVKEYKRIRESLSIYFPGYMIHESGVWSDIHQKWFFLPRRCSQEQYNETLDEHRGCSYLIAADEYVRNVQLTKVANSQPTRGFSSFKFIPSTNDEVIVALRSEELEGKTATYITAFNIKGDILLDDSHIADLKYEGIEFI